MSNSKSTVVKQLMQQELALDSYLATLLAEIPATEHIDKKAQRVQGLVEKPVKPKVKTVQKEKLPQQPEELNSSAIEVHAVTPVKPLAIMPEYTQEEFSALFFRVGNLVLAAPLTDLLRTIKFDGNVTKIPQQPVWFMGLKVEQDKKVGILNMSYLVHGKSRAGNRSYEVQPFKNVILTVDGNWGLACDEILSITKVQPDKVRWRTDRQKKPWLVGTVIDELVAIVDVNKLVPERKR